MPSLENQTPPELGTTLNLRSKTAFPAACRAAQTPLYVRPHHRDRPSAIPLRPRRNGHAATGSVVAKRFRSLRLSVRTPPFHGGESGSIPLGSASIFNGLALT